jgi:hypothetical protein
MRPILVMLAFAACGGSSRAPPDAPSVPDAPLAFDAPLALDAPQRVVDAMRFGPDAPAPDAPCPNGGPFGGRCESFGQRCTNMSGDLCFCTGAGGWGWICNPPGCPEPLSGEHSCAQPGLECQDCEFSIICVGPENVWVSCDPFSKCVLPVFPTDGAPCCGEPGYLPEWAVHCDTGGCASGSSITCDCKADNHWHCQFTACADAGVH